MNHLSRTIATGLKSISLMLIVACMYPLHSIVALEADLSITRFRTPDKTYVELFVYILGNSVHAVYTDSVHRASVNVTYMISSDSGVITGDRYNLLSSGNEFVPDFMDLRRHVLNPGTYSITLELMDNHDSTNAVTLSKEFIVEQSGTTLSQSDIQFLGHIEPSTEESVWMRNGWRMTPLPYSWYRADVDKMYFYHELYHTDVTPGTDFFITYAILPDNDPDKILLQGHKRMKPKQINTLLQAIDIAGLGSGEYFLRIGVYDQEKNQLSLIEKDFMRSNPKADAEFVSHRGSYFEESFTLNIGKDSLRYALKALAPKISQIQVPVLNYLLEKGEPENQRRFLHQFWVETNPMDPETAYKEYMTLAAAVDLQYHSAFGYGFETDRGHIMLKYGFPDDIIAVDDEPSAPPYEIWFYNDFPLTSQSDVRFLFYNPSLAGGDYKLLHSTATGEVRNPRWQQQLYSDALTEPEGGDFIDARGVRDNFHRRAVEYFED